jgi:putative hydrolase of the HAD superfamily
MLRAVIFDLFHTLTGVESQWSTVPFTCDVLGIDRVRWDTVLHSQSRWRLVGEEQDPWKILRRLADTVDPTIADATVAAAMETRSQRFREATCSVPPQNLDTLKRLRSSGLGLGLISNADASEVVGWSDSPLRGLFDAEVFSCRVGFAKPEPQIYAECLRQLRMSAAECLYVGDGGSNELVGARAAGLQTVFISGVIEELWPAPHCGTNRAGRSPHHSSIGDRGYRRGMPPVLNIPPPPERPRVS